MNRVIGLDFETRYCEKEGFGIKQQGMVRYIKDERFDPYLISVSDGADTWAGQPKNFNWSSLDGATLVSHNRAFDETVYEEMVLRGLAPRVDLQAWHCTANLAVYLCMRRDLVRACEFLLGVSIDKSVRGNAEGKGWDDLVKEDGGESMLEYARGDALRCWQIWAKYGHLWPERERRLSDLTIRQCRRGAQIDEQKLRKFLLVAQTMLIQAEAELPWMKEGKKPTSPKAVAEECRREGIPCAPVKSRHGEEAYDEWAAIFAPKYRWVKAYTDYRVIHKFIDTLETVQGRLSPEGIFSYELLYFGAHTGRWSGAGGFNIQNMRKQPLYCDTDGRLITDEKLLKEVDETFGKTGNYPAFVAHSLDLRSLFIARPGKKMIVSDLSQIEPRVLAWLVNDTAMLERMAGGQSPYQAHAEATMKWTRGDMKKLGAAGDFDAKKLYALAKARVIGLGYQCGPDKFITVAMKMAGLDVTEDDPEFIQAVSDEGNPCFDAGGHPIMVSGYGYNSRRIVKEYRESNPLVVGLWKRLDSAFRNSVGGDFEMELPSGRSLRYPDVRRERKAVADPDNPKKFSHRLVHTALAFDQKRNAVVRKPFYGGILTENLDQGISRDAFGERLLALDETSGIDVLFSSHDEAVVEVDSGITEKHVDSIMSVAPEWMPGLPVAAETHEVKHYCK